MIKLILTPFLFQLFYISVHGQCPMINSRHYDTNENELSQSNSNYLQSPAYDTYATVCHYDHNQPPFLSKNELLNAHKSASRDIEKYAYNDREANRLSRAKPFSQRLVNIEHRSVFMELVTKYVQEVNCLSKKWIIQYLPSVKLSENQWSSEWSTCDLNQQEQRTTCSLSYPYRTYDGSCNNIKRPLLGQTNDCQHRLLPADYRDGISELTTSSDGSPLPNPRKLSLEVLGQDEHR